MPRYEEEQSSRRKRYDDGYSNGHGSRDSYSSSSRRRSPNRSRSPDHRRRRDYEYEGSSHRSRRDNEDDWRRRRDAEDGRVRRREYSDVDNHRDGERYGSRSSKRERIDATESYSALHKRSRSRSPPRNGSNVAQTKNPVNSGSIAASKPDDKLKSKKEKLEAWRREREKKALDEARQRAATVTASLDKASECIRREVVTCKLSQFALSSQFQLRFLRQRQTYLRLSRLQISKVYHQRQSWTFPRASKRTSLLWTM